jgi:hypothetical protein
VEGVVRGKARRMGGEEYGVSDKESDGTHQKIRALADKENTSLKTTRIYNVCTAY